MTKQKQDKLFKGSWLQVRDPVEPDLINWHNFGVRKV